MKTIVITLAFALALCAQQPAAPTGVTAELVNCGKARIRWDAPTVAVSRYEIYRRSLGGAFPVGTWIIHRHYIAPTKTGAAVFLTATGDNTFNLHAVSADGTKSDPVMVMVSPMPCNYPATTAVGSGPVGGQNSAFADHLDGKYVACSHNWAAQTISLHVGDGATFTRIDTSIPLFELDLMCKWASPDTVIISVGRDRSQNQSLYEFNVTSRSVVSSYQVPSPYAHAGLNLMRTQFGVTFAWHADSADANNNLLVHLTRKSSAGWQTFGPFPLTPLTGGGIVKTKIVVERHPEDGRIWVFSKRDSFQWIAAQIFTESPSGIILQETRPSFISHDVHGVNGPEGEFPWLSVVPVGNSLALAYQSNSWQILTDTTNFATWHVKENNFPFAKGAEPVIASFSATGAPTFVRVPQITERISSLAVGDIGGVPVLAYKAMDRLDLSWNELRLGTAVIGATNQNVGFSIAGGRLFFTNPDGALKVHTPAAPPPPPPPPPVVCTPIGKSGKMRCR